MTAGIFRLRTVDRMTGSMRVRCVQTNKTPEFEPEGGGGGFPLTTILPPKTRATKGMAHIGNIRPRAMRIMASMMPSGIHRRIRRAVVGVGRLTRRPSWKITGKGWLSWWSCPLVAVNGGCDCSCQEAIVCVN